MKATDLFNYRKEDFETIESFSKRVYETAKRYRSSLHFTLYTARKLSCTNYTRKIL